MTLNYWVCIQCGALDGKFIVGFEDDDPGDMLIFCGHCGEGQQ